MDLDNQISEDLKQAVERTFSRMFNIEVSSEIAAASTLNLITGGDVYGAVSLVNEKVLGSFVVGFPKDTMFQLLKLFYKKDFTTIDRSSLQMVGELTNIMFGVFKNLQNDGGVVFKMAIPQMIIADNHRIPDATMVLHGKFACNLGSFYVHIAVKPVD